MHFGDVFDLPRLRQSLRMPLIEWRELKDIEAGRKQPLEPLGCWSLWQAYDQMNHKPRPNFITGELQLALGTLFLLAMSLTITYLQRPRSVLHAHCTAGKTFIEPTWRGTC